MSKIALCIKRAYGGALPTQLLSSQLPKGTMEDLQQNLVDEILLSSHFEEYPPSYQYRRSFWKFFVEKLETMGQEVDERIYQEYLNLLSNSALSEGGNHESTYFHTHFWSFRDVNNTLNKSQTTLRESRNMIENGTTGLRTWGASLSLAAWLTMNSNVVSNKAVLELGSGAGFLGLIIAELQLHNESLRESALILSDVNSEVLSRCRENFELACNKTARHPSLEFRLLDWNEALDEQISSKGSSMRTLLERADIVMGADLVYDVTIIPALVAVISMFLRLKLTAPSKIKPCAYIALTMRRQETVRTFLELLTSHRLSYSEDSLSNDQFTGGLQDAECPVKLYRITQIAALL